jgi:hypothetical protein
MPSNRPVWSAEAARPAFRVELIFTALLLAAALAGLASFLRGIEERPGAVLNDPVLASGSPVDLTWLTFLLIYGSLVAAVVTLAPRPRALLLAVQSYCVMVAFRMLAMWVTPLDPPPTMLPLVDPFVEFFGTGTTLTRDLFFSGHTATLFLLGLTSRGRVWRWFFFLCTAGVAAAVLLQHVHYGVDVLCAPFFAYGAYRLVLFVRSRLLKDTATGTAS